MVLFGPFDIISHNIRLSTNASIRAHLLPPSLSILILGYPTAQQVTYDLLSPAPPPSTPWHHWAYALYMHPYHPTPSRSPMPLAFSSYSYLKQKDRTGDPWRVMMRIINEIVLRLVLEKNFYWLPCTLSRWRGHRCGAWAQGCQGMAYGGARDRRSRAAHLVVG